MAQRPNRQQQQQQQQQFRYWLPFWNNPIPTPQQPMAQPPQRTVSRIPTSTLAQPPTQPRAPAKSTTLPPSQEAPAPQPQLPPSTAPPLQPTAPRGDSQPSTKEAAVPQPQLPPPAGSQLQPSASRRSSQPSPSPTASPRPRRSPRSQPAEQGVTTRPSPSRSPSKPSSPAKEASLMEARTDLQPSQPTERSKEVQPTIPQRPQLISPTLPSVTQPDSPAQSIPAESHNTPQDMIEVADQEKIKAQPSPHQDDVKHEPKMNLEPKQTSVDSLQKDIASEPVHTTQDQATMSENSPEKMKEENPKPNLEPKQTTKSPQVPNLYDEPKEIPNEKPKLMFEQELNPTETKRLQENLETILQEMAQPKLQNKHEANPAEPQKPDTIIDYKRVKISETQEQPQRGIGEVPNKITETQEQPQRGIGEVPNKITEPKPVTTVSDSKSNSPQRSTSEMVSDTRVREPEKLKEQAKVNEKEVTQSTANWKGRKLSISSNSLASSSNGERTNFQKEIREGLSKLVQKLSIGHSGQAGKDQAVSIITLAGQNKGASMFIGNEGITRKGFNNTQRGYKLQNDAIEGTIDEGRSKETNQRNTPVSASINSNVQSINNSVLNDSNCTEKNPGVHLTLSTKPTEPATYKGRMEHLKPQKTASNITTSQSLTYEPNIRRRCLRGLLMEPSDDDQQDPQKPRRHGCRVSCDEKRKGKADDEGGN